MSTLYILGMLFLFSLSKLRELSAIKIFEPEEVIEENIRKLSARYPHGFDVLRSENREEGDI